MLQYSIQLEEFGGEVQAVEISALTGNGLDTLEEAIIVLAELNEIQADPTGPTELKQLLLVVVVLKKDSWYEMLFINCGEMRS